MDIRLKATPYEFQGKTYKLRCNMNVLAEVQEAYNGDFQASVSGVNYMRSAVLYLAAMLNDYADEMGWGLQTPQQVGRTLSFRQLTEVWGIIRELVIDALKPETGDGGDASKN